MKTLEQLNSKRKQLIEKLEQLQQESIALHKNSVRLADSEKEKADKEVANFQSVDDAIDEGIYDESNEIRDLALSFEKIHEHISKAIYYAKP